MVVQRKGAKFSSGGKGREKIVLPLTSKGPGFLPQNSAAQDREEIRCNFSVHIIEQERLFT